MTMILHWWARLTRRTPDPDVAAARQVLDETYRTTARVGRVLIDIDAQGWTARDRPIEDDYFPERRRSL